METRWQGQGQRPIPRWLSRIQWDNYGQKIKGKIGNGLDGSPPVDSAKLQSALTRKRVSERYLSSIASFSPVSFFWCNAFCRTSKEKKKQSRRTLWRKKTNEALESRISRLLSFSSFFFSPSVSTIFHLKTICWIWSLKISTARNVGGITSTKFNKWQ